MQLQIVMLLCDVSTLLRKKKQKQLPYFRASFVWATTWGVLQTTSNPDSNLQAGLWVPIF